MTINRSWGLGVGLQKAGAANALSSANDNQQRPPLPSRNTHSSDRGCSDGGGSDSLAPLSNCRSRSTMSTPIMDGSAHSLVSSGRQGKYIICGPSVLGLDNMIDEKRDARTMSECVVHIEVCTIKLPILLASIRFQRVDALKNKHFPFVAHIPKKYRSLLASPLRRSMAACM